MMGSLLKYHMAPIKDDRAFRALVKGDEFRIEFGEFLDWKIVLAAEYPEVDLFNSRGRQFPHRQFQDKIFRHKKFYKFNLKGSVFEIVNSRTARLKKHLWVTACLSNAASKMSYLQMYFSLGRSFGSVPWKMWRLSA